MDANQLVSDLVESAAHPSEQDEARKVIRALLRGVVWASAFGAAVANKREPYPVADSALRELNKTLT